MWYVTSRSLFQSAGLSVLNFTFRIIAITVVILACCSPPAFCADGINRGDQLNILVYNHPELSSQIKVDSRGGISLPLAGYLAVSGLTLEAVDRLIEKRLAPFVNFPAVDVQSIGESQSLFVAGGPGGTLSFAPGETLTTALADVQKLLDQRDPQENNRLVITDVIDHSRLDLHRVGVDRSGTVIGVFDTVAMRATGDPGPILYADDTIVFRNKPIIVSVSGYVARPGFAYLDPSEPLSDAIEQAGGALPQAASAHVVIMSPNLAERSVALGDPLFAQPGIGGEKIFIPAAPRVQVNGLVAKPGPVVLANDFTLLGAINTAGGINKFANIKNVQLVRDGSTTTYDITRLTFGDMTQNPTLKDGDSIFVPEGHKIDFTGLFATLSNVRNASFGL
jgi:protein involved in polysaccharide export with SLBB domain